MIPRLTDLFTGSPRAGGSAAITSDQQERWHDAEEALCHRGATTSAVERTIARTFFSARQRIDFYESFATYLDRGVRLPEILVEMWEIETEGLHRLAQPIVAPLSTAIAEWLHRLIDKSESFGAIMADWLPGEERMIFVALEEAGLTRDTAKDHRGDALRGLAEVTKRKAAWSAGFKRAILPLYGVALLFTAGLYYLSVVKFPELTASLPNVEYQGAALSLKQTSDFMGQWGLPLIAFAAIAPLGFMAALPRWTGPSRLWIEDAPVLSSVLLLALYKRWTGLGFVISLAALLSARKSLTGALNDLEARAQPYVRERVSAIISYTHLTLGDAMAATGYTWPDRRTIKMIRHYIISDDPGEALNHLATSMAKRLDDELSFITVFVAYLAQFLVFAAILWFMQATNDLSDGLGINLTH